MLETLEPRYFFYIISTRVNNLTEAQVSNVAIDNVRVMTNNCIILYTIVIFLAES